MQFACTNSPTEYRHPTWSPLLRKDRPTVRLWMWAEAGFQYSQAARSPHRRLCFHQGRGSRRQTTPHSPTVCREQSLHQLEGENPRDLPITCNTHSTGKTDNRHLYFPQLSIPSWNGKHAECSLLTIYLPIQTHLSIWRSQCCHFLSSLKHFEQTLHNGTLWGITAEIRDTTTL